MRILYLLLSPTFGMHQYTADLVAQMAAKGHTVALLTTALAPRDRYDPALPIYTPLTGGTTGFGREGLRGDVLARVLRQIETLRPQVVHITGVHLWNPLLLLALRRRGVRTVHTLHDLDPHPNVAFGRLIRVWNRWVIVTADQLVVHAQRYQARLLHMGRPPATVSALPLLHSFLGYGAAQALAAGAVNPVDAGYLLFLGRLLPYKGVEVLLQAATELAIQGHPVPLTVAGGGDLTALWPRPVPPGVTLLPGLVGDEVGWELFRRCAGLVLPYTGATQSALPAAAYAFGKPVIVSDSGALAEVVEPGVTGWVTPAGDVPALAAAMAALLADPSRRQAMGQAGHSWLVAERARQRAQLDAMYRGLFQVGGNPVDSLIDVKPATACYRIKRDQK